MKFRDNFDEILIASGDKDLMQFVDGKVKMLDTMKDKLYGPEEVFEKMGVHPNQIIDYLTLLGDPSDNIPGVKGIGAKGASKLLEEFKTLDEAVKNSAKITNKRAQKALIENGGTIELSRKLITIKTDVELGYDYDSIKFELEPSQDLITFLKGLGFKTMVEKFLQFKQIDASVSNTERKIEQKPLEFQKIKNPGEWKQYFELLKKEKEVSLVPFWADDSLYFGTLLYLAIGIKKKDPLIISFGQLLRPEYILNELFSLKEMEFIGCDLKNFLSFSILKSKNLPTKIFDISQAIFVLDPSAAHDWPSVSQKYLDQSIEIVDSSKGGNLFEMDSSIQSYLVQATTGMLAVAPTLKDEVAELGCEKALYEIDLPLIPILAQMEMHGISLDVPFFENLEVEFSKELESIQAQIDEAGGEGINLRSPKQLGVLLFEILDLPVIKKNKTGPSTDSGVLQELSTMGLSEIPGLIIKYREIDKLLNTYVKTLPKLINPQTNKIHTHFQLNNAATGRLSSDNPNLQNIPMRTEKGRRLREGFIPSEGFQFLSVDYSQMELRLLAHFSQDETMMKAFKEGRDIHTQTASEVMGKEFNQVTKDERNQAKAVNFGLMYGQGSFGLAQQLGISRAEAKAYIDKYFARFNKVKSFLDSLREKSEKTGYAETMFGRKRVLKDINSTNRTVKAMAERIAINSPIQGSAADIIKISMINIQNEITKKNLKSKMILQIHDELVFEVLPEEIETLKKLVVNKMETAVDISVPLKVDLGIGKNWLDVK